MSSIMIALASAQRMQNIIPVYHRGMAINKVMLVSSTDADKPGSHLGKALSDTIAVLASSSMAVEAEKVTPSVDAYSVDSTRELIGKLMEGESSSSIVVNFTGGTKCMSIGAFMAAREAGVMALYVDTANERLLWFHPDGRIEGELVDLGGRLSIADYFRANGRPVNEEKSAKQVLSKNALSLAEELLHLWPDCSVVLNAFGDALSQKRSEIDGAGLDHKTIALLKSFGCLKEDDRMLKITDRGKRLLQKGRLLEAMAAILLTRSGSFDEVRTNVNLEEVENELDAVAIRHGKVAVLECKAGAIGGEHLLNKLLSHKSTLGSFTELFLVAAHPVNEIQRRFRERASIYGVRRIVTTEDFLDLAKIVREGMRGSS